ncbi:peptide chain release factor 1 [bacterium]|nr:peptide chain release factor 1 [bacterium]
MAHQTPVELKARLEESEKQFDFLTEQVSQPAVISDQKTFQRLSRERAALEKLVVAYREYSIKFKNYLEARDLVANEKDPDLKAMAHEEIDLLEPQLEEDLKALQILLLPKDPLDEKNTIVEVRAGVGGDEASIFAGDLYGMYRRFAESKGWKVEVLSLSEGTAGGFKEVIFSISGDEVYSWMKYETGVHRVQRVPKTETQGRVHTSTATVAVMPEADEVDIDIKPHELRIDVMRAGGAGGQHVNTTDSAVRITHLPTNTVVQCQDERSQHKNKAKAMKVLRSRLFEAAQDAQNSEIAQKRKEQVGSGMRNERIRTFNFPQGRVSDHRIGMTTYNIDEVIGGDVGPFIRALADHYQTEALKEAVK